MKLTKREIQKIQSALNKANDAENRFSMARQGLAEVIIEITNVDGNVDHLVGDGFGFTPESNNDTHIAIIDLIELAKNGEDITEELILNNLTL